MKSYGGAQWLKYKAGLSRWRGSAVVSIIPLPSTPAAPRSQLRSTAQQHCMGVIIYLHPFNSDDSERAGSGGQPFFPHQPAPSSLSRSNETTLPCSPSGPSLSVCKQMRTPGKEKGYPLQYSGLENSMECIVHDVAKSWT